MGNEGIPDRGVGDVALDKEKVLPVKEAFVMDAGKGR
jgi:hypothetical protein